MKLLITGFFSAFAASLCCIVPIITLLSGGSVVASNLSWLEPLRPYLIAITLTALAISWYLKLMSAKTEADECGCNVTKPSFLKSKRFLLLITAFTLSVLCLPYLTSIFYEKASSKSTTEFNLKKLTIAKLNVEGMTCESCEHHISSEINKLDGIKLVTVSYNNSNATVEYDSTEVSIGKIVNSINSTGYKVIQ